MSDQTPADRSPDDSANRELAQELNAMLGRRADQHPAGPDLARVVADGERALASTGGIRGRAFYLLGIAAVVLIVAGIGLFTVGGNLTGVNPTSEDAVDESAPFDPDEPTTTTWNPPPTGHLVTTTTIEFNVSTTLGCDPRLGPTNPDCDGTVLEPGEIRISEDCPADGTPCCLPGITTICYFDDPDDPPPDTTYEPGTTVPIDPDDCLQITTVPGCESLPTTTTVPDWATTTTLTTTTGP
jgi:hypothetical protein